MIPDYYLILVVSPEAPLDDIKRAYRQKAMQCHPDRGGSHAQMLEINEAFEVLADPVLRHKYDFARQHPENREAQAKSAAESRQARNKAQDYPREWAAFAKWIDDIARDARSTKFKQTELKYLGFSLPTAGESWTGWTMILGGGIAGLVLWTWLIGLSEARFSHKVLLLAGLVCGGAWLGVKLHSAVGTMLPEPESLPKDSAGPSHIVLRCPRCSQRLRLPPIAKLIQVTCANCKHIFPYDSDYR